MKPTKLLRTSLLTLGLLGILHSNIQAGEIEQKAFIERFYQNILNRTADDTGMTTWMNTIKNQSATQVAMGFLNSPELTNKNLSNEEFINIMYQTMFNRQADDGGKANWLQKMRDGRSKQSVMFGFFQSQEFKNLTDSFGVTQILPTDKPSYQGVESYVDRFYKLVLKREAEEDGFNDWVKQLTNKTKNPTEIANGFLFSPEYTNQNEDNSTFLDTCYKSFFGRDADSGGKNDWLNKITNQGYTKQQIFEGFTGSQEFKNLVDSFKLDNKSFSISGFAQKGPYLAGTGITIQPLNESLNQTGQSYTTNTINEKGEYKLNAELTTPWVEIFADGYYYDEILNSTSSSTLKLSTLVNLNDKSKININLLTALTKPRILTLMSQGKTFSDAKNQAEIEVLTAFGLSDISTIDFEDLDLNSDTDNTKILLAITSIILESAHINSNGNGNIPGELSSFVTLIKSDIEDNGILDSSMLKNQIKSASMIVDVSLIKSNLQLKYGHTFPAFEEYLDQDGNGIINKNDVSVAFKSGDTWNGLVYNIVTSPITGKQWLDRNLGASQVCTNSTDTDCYGDYYQWGRLADGHEKAGSSTTTEQSISLKSALTKFITGLDWTNVDNDGKLRAEQWSKTDGTGVCPVGFRVPTIDELQVETTGYSRINNMVNGAIKVIDSETAIQNFLKIPSAGYRFSFFGNLELDTSGNIASTSATNSGIMYLGFYYRGLLNGEFSRAAGMSVRCMKNTITTSNPVFTSETTFSVNENQKNAFTAKATDSSIITYSLNGGDSSSFDIDSATGDVTFKVEPDYEVKNSYTVKVIATNFNGSSSAQDVTINILDVDETIYNQPLITHKGLEYGIITSPITGKKWLDRNLGATKACTSSTDTACYGDYYQWGRLADGHEKANSTTTTEQATDVTNAGNKFIIESGMTWDWTNTDKNAIQRITQWNKTDGTGVCPVGFRVPTMDELKKETTDYSKTDNISTGAVKVTNSETAFKNFLKFPSAGSRSPFSYGDHSAQGGYNCSIWTNSVTGSTPWHVNISQGTSEFPTFYQWHNYHSDFGNSVRCIQGY